MRGGESDDEYESFIGNHMKTYSTLFRKYSDEKKILLFTVYIND